MRGRRRLDFTFIGSVGALDIFILLVFALLARDTGAEIPVGISRVERGSSPSASRKALVVSLRRDPTGVVYLVDGRPTALAALSAAVADARRQGKRIEVEAADRPLMELVLTLLACDVRSFGLRARAFD